jgi:acyl-coenzyme A synthetase/AMP-(fatty) acid ligase
LPKSAIMQSLRASLDEVFLPRPLLIVDRIPRNAVGKVVRSELERLLETNECSVLAAPGRRTRIAG